MGIRLAGGPVPGGQVLSEAAPIGALQVTPGGTPLLLLADRGTVGGYAKPALLHPGDLPKAGQLRTGEWVRFRIDRSVQE
jgi:allophanate hydrolase subunit 2